MTRTATAIIASILLGLMAACTAPKDASLSTKGNSVAATGGTAASAASNAESSVAADGGAGRVQLPKQPKNAGDGSVPPPPSEASSAGRGAEETSGAGSGASGEPPLGATIRGRVIDLYRQPVAAAQVTVGATTMTTDEHGVFEVAGAPATYDLVLLLGEPGNAGAPREVWVFEGLTRRDPTLQIEAAGPIRSAALELRVEGVNFDSLAEGDTIRTSFGSPVGVANTMFSIAEVVRDRVAWRGPNSTRFTGHGLRFAQGSSLPTDYYAYDNMSFDAASDGTASVVLTLARSTPLAASAIRGNLEGFSGTQPELQVYARFSDHAYIPLGYDDAAPATFSYAFPTGLGATATVVALVTDRGSVRLAHVDELIPSGAAVSLRAPPPSAALLEPANAATLGSDAMFRWSGEGAVFVFRARSFDRNDSLRVVTSKREARLPTVKGYTLPEGRDFTWWVETHGSYASVDEAAGPDGFLDTCASRVPAGPARGSGTYTESAGRDFKSR